VDDRYQVQDITVDRQQSVTVVFGDDLTHTFDLLEMRLNCPCASCRGDRDQGREPWPRPGNPQPLAVSSAELHGAWGLGITWNDGHSTGIYPWEALRRWADEGEPGFTPDSGRGL
jgi:DUF971 family protein